MLRSLIRSVIEWFDDRAAAPIMRQHVRAITATLLLPTAIAIVFGYLGMGPFAHQSRGSGASGLVHLMVSILVAGLTAGLVVRFRSTAILLRREIHLRRLLAQSGQSADKRAV
jgi:hypothetical protein